MLTFFAAGSVLLCREARAQQPEAPPVPRSPNYTGPVDSAAARRLAGCYTVRVGPWSEPRANGGFIPIPGRVELHTTSHPAPRVPGFSLVARTPGFVPARLPRADPAWSPVAADSAQLLAWSDGTSSVSVFLRRQSDGTLRGTARYFTDGIVMDAKGRWLWEVYPTARTTLTPAACSAAW